MQMLSRIIAKRMNTTISAVRFWICINRFGFGSIYRINRCFNFTLLDPSMNDVINGVMPLTIRRNYADVRNVCIKNAQKHAVTFTNQLFYNFIFLF